MNEQNREFFKQNMERSAMLMGIFSIISLFIGFSIPFGAVGIIMSLLSRGKGGLGTFAKIGLALSLFAFIFGIATTASAIYMVYTDPDYVNTLMQNLGYSDPAALTAEVIR